MSISNQPHQDPLVHIPIAEPVQAKQIAKIETPLADVSTIADQANIQPAPSKQPTNVAVTGSKQDWMIGANISPSDWRHVEAILGQESSWKVGEINSIGCIGLGQACASGNKAEMLQRCPDWATNGACQMKVWNDYAIRRYGSWSYAETWKFCTQICYNAHTGTTTNKKGEPWW